MKSDSLEDFFANLFFKEVQNMDKIIIPISPKIQAALGKSKTVIGLISDFNARLLEACADGKISFDEVLSLIASVVNIGRQLSKK